ncbi:unnamed protein product [Symbiodinium natans]|uniref:Uncharacterized protein n=1 Tax=Symbiodinium natans TaxID=878477 RepID=A0A812LH63_9DINO|nr:unnamed protein product [Symbiodinium natans]
MASGDGYRVNPSLAAWPVSLVFCLQKRWRARRGISSVRAAIKQLEPELSRFLEDWEDRSRRLAAFDVPSLDELAFFAHARPLVGLSEDLCPLAPELHQWLKGCTEAIGARLELARSDDTTAAPIRWASAEEVVEQSEADGAQLPKLLLHRASEAQGLATATAVTPLEVTELPQMFVGARARLGAAWATFWRPEPVNAEDGVTTQPLSASQVRGNWIFAACVLSTTLGFMAVSIRSSRKAAEGGG